MESVVVSVRLPPSVIVSAFTAQLVKLNVELAVKLPLVCVYDEVLVKASSTLSVPPGAFIVHALPHDFPAEVWFIELRARHVHADVPDKFMPETKVREP